MGMYTELDFHVRLNENTPDGVINILRYMVGNVENEPTFLPSHELFSTTRWARMCMGGSYYFDADPRAYLRYDKIAEQFFLGIRSNFKNYDNEIELFLDWIMPYVDAFDGDYIGYYRYEEDKVPTFIFKSGE
jgi:hypothetical protein